MLPVHVFTEAERNSLCAALGSVRADPYADRPAFAAGVAGLVERGEVPPVLLGVAERVRAERAAGVHAHALRNCPLDPDIPLLDQDDPLTDKYARKKTFIGEAFLELFGQLTATPLLSYATRFNGDFYVDVIAITRYRGKQTGYSDGELAFHNDRAAHPVRADHITLLGMRCPDSEVTYTGFVSGDALRAYVGEHLETLRQEHFVTPFDVVSRDNNRALTVSEKHAIFSGERTVRYVDTHTTVAPDAPPEAKDALIALKDALVRADKSRHRILTGDLFTFANQDGLHSREHLEITDPELAATRWLLKTYAFRDEAAAAAHADRWVDGVVGRVGD
ncbi:TauD/TfdA family dioxygenase [Actinokineospora spheciospongiae]|uniref:TauD/TfdA family dioxygenase n=1 Tax=Actinokineospora spheciospongiae TaxID=909613 RepID=UPI00054E0BCE|nr:TauD/TfdA family dioxygenase [Actinokineospora spheciospongiae]